MTKYCSFLFFLLTSCAVGKTVYLTEESVLNNAKTQPAEALIMAEPHLSEHGTVLWKNPENLKTHIIKKGRYYYIKRSDYPAKSVTYYLHSCVRVNSKNGKIDYIK